MANAKRPGEFELIRRYFAPLAAATPAALGLGDDAAILSPRAGQDLVVTADALVAGVHFLPDDPPDQIARKMLRVNLSDLAAKGATPLGYLMTCAFDGRVDEPWLASFCAGLAADQAAFGIGLLGGDTVATPGPLTLSVTAMGEVPAGRALRRNAAQAGDLVFVSGTLGDSTLGLKRLRGKLAALSAEEGIFLIDRYRLPQPRLQLGRALMEAGLAKAALDISDGLLADLGHILKNSNVGAEINLQHIPCSKVVSNHLTETPVQQMVLTGGDDYELCFTAPARNHGEIIKLSNMFALPLTRIGVITGDPGLIVRGLDNKIMDIKGTGFDHFAD